MNYRYLCRQKLATIKHLGLDDDELGRKHDNSRKTLIAAMMRKISHKNRKEYFRKYLIF